MKELIVAAGIMLVYGFVSYFLHFYFLRIKSIVKFIAISILYLVSTYYYFDLINTIDHKLTDKGVYFEWGHANIGIVMLLLLSFIIAIVNIVLSVKKRQGLKKVA